MPMHISLTLDEHQNLVSRLADDQTTTTASAADAPEALRGLSEALDDLEENGFGECFWSQSSGDYRWVFRRSEERVRLAVLWCASVAVGFQHVYWGEAEMRPWVAALRAEIASVQIPQPR
ncbi:MAG: hypothetical protein HY858_14315 [Candidatus Solibacter usitatus]|nr:hypothetical protein [Candidatus Solibacter usitatus]